MKNFFIHDLALFDAPAFHLVMDTCANGEVYNMAIRGANEGGLDGIDVWGTNIWIHGVSSVYGFKMIRFRDLILCESQVMVTNRDECVTVKVQSTNSTFLGSVAYGPF